MANYLASDTDLTAVANAIRAKGGTSVQLTFPNGFVSAVEAIDTSGGGGGEAVVADEKNVNFIDYDGTILYSYTASEFAALTALPANPAHDGLVSQGWNWTLADAKTHAAKYGNLVVGQMYVTNDGKTRLYISVTNRLSLYLGLKVSGTATIDWGDGSTDTVSGTNAVTNTAHTYSAAGNHVISIAVSSGTVTISTDKVIINGGTTSLNGETPYRSMLRKVEIGNSCSIDSGAFKNFYHLESVTIPQSHHFSGTNNTFSHCHVLKAVTLTTGITALSGNVFDGCYSLKFVSLPYGVTSLGASVFSTCYNLLAASIPDTVTSLGNGVFNQSQSIGFISVPSSITTLGSSFAERCFSLKKLRFEPSTPPTVSNSNTFTMIPTDCVISVPTGTLSAYTSATNYPNPATYTYIEE